MAVYASRLALRQNIFPPFVNVCCFQRHKYFFVRFLNKESAEPDLEYINDRRTTDLKETGESLDSKSLRKFKSFDAAF